MRDTVVLCKTLRHADVAFQMFCKKWDHLIDSKKRYKATLKDGRRIMFKSEQGNQNTLRGIKANVFLIDEFEMKE